MRSTWGTTSVGYPWNWNYRRLWTTIWCWESNLGPLKDQPVLLTAKPSLQPQTFVVIFETGSHYVDHAGLEQIEKSTCLCLLTVGVMGCTATAHQPQVCFCFSFLFETGSYCAAEVTTKVPRRNWVPWSWSSRPVKLTQHGCWEANSSPLQEQALLTYKQSLQFYKSQQFL